MLKKLKKTKTFFKARKALQNKAKLFKIYATQKKSLKPTKIKNKNSLDRIL
jgi:hypothetical protein